MGGPSSKLGESLRKLQLWQGLGSSWVSFGASWEGPEASWEGEGRREKNGAFLVCGDTIGHRPLWGRCPIVVSGYSIRYMLIYCAGDTDTIASMTGSIAGAYWGVEAVDAMPSASCEGLEDARTDFFCGRKAFS